MTSIILVSGRAVLWPAFFHSDPLDALHILISQCLIFFLLDGERSPCPRIRRPDRFMKSSLFLMSLSASCILW